MNPLIERLVELALEEDLNGQQDHTSHAIFPGDLKAKAKILAKENGVLSGRDVAHYVFHQVDRDIKIRWLFGEGELIAHGDVIAEVEGNARNLLVAERPALNFLQRMSGIATKTRHLADMIAQYPATLLDTRKTTPGLRLLEKQAVKAGGGANHRMGLYDAVMVKDNHIDFCGGVGAAIEKVHAYLENEGLDIPVIVEVRDKQELDEVLSAGGIKRVLLDNFLPDALKVAVEYVDGRLETEASGGINESNIVDYAKTGVQFISMGALTHQIASLDISMTAELS